MAKGCVFCGIVRGEERASVVHEDDVCVAFMDLFPIRSGHVLVVPRAHAVHLHELPEAVRAHLFVVATRVMEAQRAAGIGWQGGNVLVNDGPAAGQHVAHVHVHAIPRARGDTVRVAARMVLRVLSVFGLPGNRRRLDRLADAIRAHLPASGDADRGVIR
jgi:histidine triad (HIT) family protein